MSPIDYVIHLFMTVFVIFGIYQFYFWCQRQRWVASRQFGTRIDDLIPYWPVWAWVYSFIYYPAIVYLNWTVESPRQFNHMAMSFFLLLAGQMVFFVFMPVETPPRWRELVTRDRASERFLLYVQKFDSSRNCFPSMHMSVATLTAFHASRTLGGAAFAFPVLIGVSCVLTKQHYLIDVPAGAVLGYGAWRLFLLLS